MRFNGSKGIFPTVEISLHCLLPVFDEISASQALSDNLSDLKLHYVVKNVPLRIHSD